MAAGDKSVAPLAAFYAAHHVLVKGALFLAVGVAALTASQRIGIVVVPGVVIALGLAGLPLTGGALAKLAVKDPLGYGIAGTLASFIGVRNNPSDAALSAPARIDCGARPGQAGGRQTRRAVAGDGSRFHHGPLDTVSFAGIGSLSDALAPAALWKVLWPVLLGGVLAVGLRRWGHRLPRIPEGDVVVASGVVARAAAACGAVLERADGLLRQWAIASLSLLMVAILLALAMLAD